MTEDKKAAPAKEEAKKEETKKTEDKIDRAFPDVKPGTVVRVHQEITELNPKGEEKKRIQVFEGTVLGRKHGKATNATVTVRKISGGIAVEKIFPLHSPTIKKIEVTKKFRVKQAKIGFIREKHKRLKEIKD